MFQTLADKVPYDIHLPERSRQISIFNAVLNGTLYDSLKREFHEEREGQDNQEYVPLRKRRPSVRYNLCQILVKDSTSLLFGDDKFPEIECKNREAKALIAAIAHEVGLQGVMLDAAYRGSVGSIALHLRVLKGRVFINVIGTACLTPAFDPEEPDTLLNVTEKYTVKGRDLIKAGYSVAEEDLDVLFWFQRIWDRVAELWFLPGKVHQPLAEANRPLVVDDARSVRHDLGLVPLVWIQNLPSGDPIDGMCSFKGGIDTQIEIEYQLSQGGRGLKYSSDPLLMIREPAAPGDNFVRSSDNALIVSKDGDARMLEIGGTASAAVLEYCRALRELALESMHGNRANADRVAAAQSGKVMELLHQPLIMLADKLRTSYGDGGLLPLIRMLVEISKRKPLRLRSGEIGVITPESDLSLRWGPWFHFMEADRQLQASTLGQLRTNNLMSRQTAVNVLSGSYDIADPQAELVLIEQDIVEDDARLARQAAQVKATESVPS